MTNTTTSNIEIAHPFTSTEEKREALVKLADVIAKIMFFFQEEDQDTLFDVIEGELVINQDEMEDYAALLWFMAVPAIAAMGIKIIGKDSNGKYVATIEPWKSSKDFFVEVGGYDPNHVYFETYLDDSEPSTSVFGAYEKYLIGE